MVSLSLIMRPNLIYNRMIIKINEGQPCVLEKKETKHLMLKMNQKSILTKRVVKRKLKECVMKTTLSKRNPEVRLIFRMMEQEKTRTEVTTTGIKVFILIKVPIMYLK